MLMPSTRYAIRAEKATVELRKCQTWVPWDCRRTLPGVCAPIRSLSMQQRPGGMGVAVGIAQPLRPAGDAPYITLGTLIEPATGGRMQAGSPSLRTTMFS